MALIITLFWDTDSIKGERITQFLSLSPAGGIGTISQQKHSHSSAIHTTTTILMSCTRRKGVHSLPSEHSINPSTGMCLWQSFLVCIFAVEWESEEMRNTVHHCVIAFTGWLLELFFHHCTGKYGNGRWMAEVDGRTTRNRASDNSKRKE